MSDSEVLAAARRALADVINIQCAKGNYDYDPYMHGMANGLLLAQSFLQERELVFMEAPEVWGCDKPETVEVISEGTGV